MSLIKNKNLGQKGKEVLSQIRKRDGSIVPFDEARVVNAIWKAMRASGEGDEKGAAMVAKVVVKDLQGLARSGGLA